MENMLLDYLNYDPQEDLDKFSKIPTEEWIKIGEQVALANFHKTARDVPAYKDFLKRNSFDPDEVKTTEDFKKIPILTKDNYLRKYNLKDLAENGNLDRAIVYFMTSGSTGKPFYWPRPSDIGSLKGVELLFRYYFAIDKKKTLVINSFAMGPWGAGEIFHFSSKLAGIKGSNITVISPGTNVELFTPIFKDLAAGYEQIIICGYPSFIKDLIDTGESNGINFKNYNIGIVIGGENYSAKWSELLINKLGAKNAMVIASVYGASEGGVLGISSFFTDFLRSYLVTNKEFSKEFFSKENPPSIVHFIPPSKHLEIVKGEIIMTTAGIIPLIRYNMKDSGKILKPSEIINALPKNFLHKYKANNKKPIFTLPIVTIAGRSDKTIILFGANIYQEQIQESLESDTLQQILTGRFIAEKLENDNSDPYLKLTLEMKPKIKPSKILSLNIREEISVSLSRINAEYNNVLKTSGPKAKPVITLKGYSSEEVRMVSGKGSLVKN